MPINANPGSARSINNSAQEVIECLERIHPVEDQQPYIDEQLALAKKVAPSDKDYADRIVASMKEIKDYAEKEEREIKDLIRNIYDRMGKFNLKSATSFDFEQYRKAMWAGMRFMDAYGGNSKPKKCKT